MPLDTQILIVEDEKLAGEVIRDHLQDAGYAVALFQSATEGLAYFNAHTVDLVLLDYRLPDMTGDKVLESMRRANPLVPVIIMTAYSSVPMAVSLLQAGAWTYLTKPLEMTALMHEIRRSLEHITLQRENQRLHESLQERFSHPDLVFQSPGMQQAMNLALRAADSEASILIRGESGTGKEVVASIIHAHSPRRQGPLVKVNLAALPETLVEAELFGSVKGAFTGAMERHGRFEEARGGTLFLDEIGELPPQVQVKLLRAIQEHEVTPLGTNKSVTVDFRLITATHRDLEKEITAGRFRNDLFFRLNVIPISLPPLRERKEEIPALVDLFIRKFNARENKAVTAISREALDLLVKYPYPGNIRELENIMERAVILSRSATLTTSDLPLFLIPAAGNQAEAGDGSSRKGSLAERLAAQEKRIIRDSLERNQYNQSQAAKELGVSESGLRYKLRQLGIPTRREVKK